MSAPLSFLYQTAPAIFGMVLMLAFFSANVSAQTLAFPGAEGAGKYVTGGRGTVATPTTVFEVTSLGDNNVSGTLRYACSQSAAYRTIVFRISGTIHLNSELRIPGNTTIAGQTSPGDGICLADFWVVLNANNIIIRHMRFRMGDKNQLITNSSDTNCQPIFPPFTDACKPLADVSGSYDSLGSSYKADFMIDHCSVSWCDDEALSLKLCDNTTVQWCLVSEPLDYSYHYEGVETDFQHHAYGGIFGGFHSSLHHNIYAHCKSRTPRFAASSTDKTRVDFRNNVIYNWQINTAYGGEGGEFNIVSNYYKAGLNTTTDHRIVGTEPDAKYYMTGNKMVGKDGENGATSVSVTLNNWLGASSGAGSQAALELTAPILTNVALITQHTADETYAIVLAQAGATLPKRDAIDTRIVNEIQTKTGKIIDVQGGYPHGTPYSISSNAWPALLSTAAPTDTDHDGMPDTWETANGLNPNSATDRNNRNAEGYTMLEVYLNSIGSITGPAAPTITTQPTNQTVTIGQTATLTCAASGTFPLSYQWYFDTNSTLANQTNSSLTLPNVQLTNAGNYFAVVTNALGATTSSVAILTISLPSSPSITAQPANQTVTVGQTATFAVIAGGTTPLSYQWYCNTNNSLAGKTNATLTLPNTQVSNAGSYNVVVTNSAGSVTSAPALLTVSTNSGGVLLAYEPFTNSPGTAIIGSGGGFGFSGPWQNYNASSGVATNTSFGLSYTDASGNRLITSGGAGFYQGLTSANTSMQPTRLFSFARGTNGTDGTTTWISFLAVRQGPAVSGSNPYARGANVVQEIDTGNIQKLAVGNNSGATANVVTLITQGSGNNKSTSVVFSQTNFIVVRIDHNIAANDDAYLFINPNLSAEPAIGSANTNFIGAYDYSFDRLRVFAGGNASAAQPYAEVVIDEYRVGSTYAAVTPFVDQSATTNPPAPTGLLATASNSLIHLEWNLVADATAYNLKRGTTSGGPYPTVFSGLTTTNYEDGNVVNGVTYYYVVTATSTGGESTNSISTSVTALPSLASPRLIALMLGDQLQLSWPPDHLGWRLQNQTNGLSESIWNIVPNSELTNQMYLPIGPTDAGIFFRLIYP